MNESFGHLISALPLSIADKIPSTDENTSEPRASSSADLARAKKEKAAAAAEDDNSSSHIDSEREVVRDVDDNYFQKFSNGFADYGFAHPSVSRPCRTTWIPDDSEVYESVADGDDAPKRGLGAEEVRANEAQGIPATTAGATMDAKGNVQTFAAPVDVDKF